MRNPYACLTEDSKRRANVGTCNRCGQDKPIGVEEINGQAVRLCEDCGCKVFRELARANGRTTSAKPRKPAQAAKPAARPAKPRPVPKPAPAKLEHPAPLPAPATPQATPPAPLTAVDWARHARRKGWAVLFGRPEDQVRAYAAREQYLVSYPAAIAELARIESSRYWITRKAV